MSERESMAEPGMTLDDRYELVEEIARGGFGLVYRAKQLNMDREVAIKMVPPDFMDLPDVVERFEREARLASRLNHPNTITVHDYGKHEDHLFLVMELLQGEDLADLLARERSVDLDRIARIAKQVLKSLNEAHQQGIIHRDLKPENIFLTEISGESDFVKVVDFGIAKLAMPEMNQEAAPDKNLTIEGNTVGTPTYMSPEQAAGGDIDARSDLYALGVMMYEMAAGSPPFDADEPAKLMRQHIFQDIPKLPEEALRDSWVRPVVRRAMAKEKDSRYQDADAFIDAIDYAIEAADDDRAFAPTQEQETVDDGLEEDSLEIVDDPTSEQRMAESDRHTGSHSSPAEAGSDNPAIRAPSTEENTGSSVMTVLERNTEDDVIVLDDPKETDESGQDRESVEPRDVSHRTRQSDARGASDASASAARDEPVSRETGNHVGPDDSAPVRAQQTDSAEVQERRSTRNSRDQVASSTSPDPEREPWEWRGEGDSDELDFDDDLETAAYGGTNWLSLTLGLLLVVAVVLGAYVYLYGVPPSLVGS